MLIAGEDNYNAQVATLKRQYFWDKKFPLDHYPQRQTMPGDTTERYDLAFPAFKKLRFAFDKPYRFHRWNMLLENIMYDPETSVCSYDLDLFFQQWAPEPRYDEYDKTRRRAKKKAGLVIIIADICLVEINEGCLSEKNSEATHKWPGTGNSEENQNANYSSLFLTGGTCR